MKDKFSQQSKSYSQFRPTYPNELVNYISSLCKNHNCAWDCGTGNGQLAVLLSQKFINVCATDISEKQISNAKKISNITYKVECAESTSYENNYFDLIFVAQALHWFDLERFFNEVNRTLKTNGIFAAIGYSLIKISPEIDEIINEFYSETLGGFWDPERKLVDEKYENIIFPFEEITHNKKFFISADWTMTHLEGYLNSWSAVQNFKESNSYNPVSKIIDSASHYLKKNNFFKVSFSIFIKIRLKKDLT